MPLESMTYYRHRGAALLRAAAGTLDPGPGWWPDLDDADSCLAWMRAVWALPGFADEVWHSSPSLARNVDQYVNGRRGRGKEVRRACTSLIRYLLRSAGRPTPFGLFAGVAPVRLGSSAAVRWGDDHRALARVDTQWLADVVERLEQVPELLDRLDVQFSNLAVRRGDHVETPYGPERSRVRCTKAVQAVQEATATPVRAGHVMEQLLGLFPNGSRASLLALLGGLIQKGLLITNLRAPFTVVDPLLHVIDVLSEVGAEQIPAVATIVHRLETIHTALRVHNQPGTGADRRRHRAEIIEWMRGLSTEGRSPLSVDLLLDCEMQLPTSVAEEMQHAANVMLRLSRRPSGDAAWQDFHTRFIERYGTGALVPVTEVTDLDSGLGFPASYLGSVASDPIEPPTHRDQALLALAMRGLADSTGEVELTEEIIRELTIGNRFDGRHFPAHVELAARIQAESTEALDAGQYTLVVSPARSAGTLTCRFSALSTGTGLEPVYRSLPVTVKGASPVQMSFPPAYPHAENVCRIPAYLPLTMRFGEHHRPDPDTDVTMDDLAILATGERLYLVSIARNRIIEPQVLHALALQKQPPPVVRFLAHLARGFGALWTEVDWGPHCLELPYLPRLRYRRNIISPARWHLPAAALPGPTASAGDWTRALNEWRALWRCPSVLELRDDDRTLRLDLTVPAHQAIVREHLAKHSKATFSETPQSADAYGWAGGHAHEIAVPFVSSGSTAPSPLDDRPPMIVNRRGHTPGAPASEWLQLKIHTHPERMDELITAHLPALLRSIDGDPRMWFVRYRSPLELPHLRVRLHIPDLYHHAAYMAAAGHWAQDLRDAGLIGHVVTDTYYPEVGRYGDGPAMQAAEDVFVADSHLVMALLRHRPALGSSPLVLAALSLVATVDGMLGSTGAAMDWLIRQPAISGPSLDREDLRCVLDTTRPGAGMPSLTWPEKVTTAWKVRTFTLAAYAEHIPDEATGRVVSSLLHMHHNRLVGIDAAGEGNARRLARHAALAFSARQEQAE